MKPLRMRERRRYPALAAVVMPLGILATQVVTAAARDASAPADAIAQAGGPSLPDAQSPIGPLRRGANGDIEIIDPTTEKGSGARLCDAGTICVGKGQAYPSLSAALAVARSGGIIEIIGGTYPETVALTVPNLTIRGVAGRPHFDCTGLRVTADKACFVIAAPDVTLENLEISGAVVSVDLGANGACIRADPDTTFTLRDILCHGSQEGILSGAKSAVIENSEFYDNGWNGQTHNVYFSGDCDSVIVRGSIFRDARVGHEFKSRCRKTEISDSTFRSTKGSRDLDIPDGGDTMVYRSTLVKTEGARKRRDRRLRRGILPLSRDHAAQGRAHRQFAARMPTSAISTDAAAMPSFSTA